MRVTLKYKFLLFFLLLGMGFINAQKKPFVKKDTVYFEKPLAPNSEQINYEKQIKDLNNEVANLTKIVGDTKQSFYDSKLNFWNYLVTVIALFFVLVAYMGLRSISEKISDLKYDNEKASSKSETFIKEIKNDLLNRISEIKDDVRDFKSEQNKVFEKFEIEANNKIKQGLDSELSKAIDKVMKGSFENVLNEIFDNLNALTKRVDKFSVNVENKQTSTEESVLIAPLNIEPKTNAFDDE